MTDKDIIKALECCGIKTDCKGCYFDTHESEDVCAREIVKNAFDLINRQQTEIERLQKKVDELAEVLSDAIKIRYKEAKSEAIKEFAEQLKQTITNEINTYYNSNGGGYYLAEDTIEDIDNLVKEMAGNAE